MPFLQFFIYAFIIVLIFYLLAKICDEYFVGSLSIISKKLKLPGDVAGATFMAMGSSAPELFTATMALVIPGGHEQIGAGTIVGSAIFNILVIIGASAIVTTAVLSWQPVLRDSLFYIISILVLLFTFKDGVISAWEAIVFVGFYIFYIFTVFYWQRILPYHDLDFMNQVEEDLKEEEQKTEERTVFGKIIKGIDLIFAKIIPNPKQDPQKYLRIFLISIGFIGGLSWILVETAVKMAHLLNISDSIIALTILAAGTSIPDMISSVIVARKGQGGMAISNAIGSNIFDILFGLGLPWFIFTLFKGDVAVSTENLFSSIVLLFATVIMVLFLMIFHRWKVTKSAGIILISIYFIYLGYVVYITAFPEGFEDLRLFQASLEAL